MPLFLKYMILLRLYDSDCFVKLRKSVIVMLEVIDLLLMSPAASNDAVNTASGQASTCGPRIMTVLRLNWRASNYKM